MKKLKQYFVLAAALSFAMPCVAHAESYRAVVSSGDQPGVEQEVFFDYENGNWHGAPVAETGRVSAWKDINENTHKILLPDGRQLVTLNNLPAVKMPDGKIRPI